MNVNHSSMPGTTRKRARARRVFEIAVDVGIVNLAVGKTW